MSEEKKTAGLAVTGHNMDKLKEDVKKGVDQIEGLKLDRTAINEKIAAVRSSLEAKGIKKEALDMAMKYMNWDDDKREGFDLAYSIVREAIGLTLKTDQLDMHDAMGEGVKS